MGALESISSVPPYVGAEVTSAQADVRLCVGFARPVWTQGIVRRGYVTVHGAYTAARLPRHIHTRGQLGEQIARRQAPVPRPVRKSAFMYAARYREMWQKKHWLATFVEHVYCTSALSARAASSIVRLAVAGVLHFVSCFGSKN